MLSIGGNDLGFADIIRACVAGLRRRSTGPCEPRTSSRRSTQRWHGRARMWAKTIDEVRAVMAEGWLHPF